MIVNEDFKGRRARPPLVCHYCGTPARLDDGSAIGRNKPVWLCGRYPDCDSYVGCHPGGTIALGSLASRELRLARMSAHDRMDQYWRHSKGRISRRQMYELVATLMGRKTFHCGTAREADMEAFNAAWPRIADAARQLLAAPEIRLDAITGAGGDDPHARLREAVAKARQRMRAAQSQTFSKEHPHD